MKKTAFREVLGAVNRLRELSPQYREAKKRFDAAPTDAHPHSKQKWAEAHRALHDIESEQDSLWAKVDELSKGISANIDRFEAAIDLANAVRVLQS